MRFLAILGHSGLKTPKGPPTGGRIRKSGQNCCISEPQHKKPMLFCHFCTPRPDHAPWDQDNLIWGRAIWPSLNPSGAHNGPKNTIRPYLGLRGSKLQVGGHFSKGANLHCVHPSRRPKRTSGPEGPPLQNCPAWVPEHPKPELLWPQTFHLVGVRCGKCVGPIGHGL